MPSEHVLQVEGVGKRYDIFERPGDRLKQHLLRPIARAVGFGPVSFGREFWALDDVSFSVSPRESVGILGRNGSGKSTLLQIICGTLKATTGRVRSHARIGALLELGAGFNPEFTGRENVRLNALIAGLSPREVDARMDEILAFADIGDFIDQPVNTYSSGMFVRLAFSVQACLEPDILVVDEALAVGDEKFQRKCYDYMDKLRERGSAVILVSHSTATIEKYCDRALLLHRGRMHAIGPANKIIDQYHALLYADEAAYLRLVNQAAPTNEGAGTDIAPATAPAGNGAEAGRCRALITGWSLTDASGQAREYFRPCEKATFKVVVAVFEPVPEIQVGISIKTVEGVVAFGTSTDYHHVNASGLEKDQTIEVSFAVDLNLCASSYFVSFAAAEKVKDGSMLYLDKRTDDLVFRIEEVAVQGTGIAHLAPQITTHVGPSRHAE